MGEYLIAAKAGEVRIMRSDSTNEVRVYVDASQEELEARKEYKG